jgi:plastocyanin
MNQSLITKRVQSLFFVLALCLLGSFYVFFVRKEVVCPEITGEITMSISDETFEPQNLSIKQCTKVTFTNIGKELHWPASDLHPTHLTYPEFDPQRPLNSDESWDFVFDKPGKWKCHDHLSPKTRCIVEVLK